MDLPSQFARRAGSAGASDRPFDTVSRGRVLGRSGATPAWIPILLGVAGVAVGLLLAYFFSSCPLPGSAASDIETYQYVEDVCGPDIASISIRPPDLVIPVKPLGLTDAPLEFEVEALAYRSDGGGIAPECDLGLVWEATPPVSALEITGNRARVTIQSTALASPFDGQVHARLADSPSVSSSANIRVVGQGYGIRDSVRADHDGAVAVGLVDGAVAYQFGSGTSYLCVDAQPVSFVSVGLLPNLGALCPESFQGAAIFDAKKGAWFQGLTSGSWGMNSVDKVDATGKSTALEPIQVAVWIAIDGATDLDDLSLSEARDEARYDAIADGAWANLVFRNERVGLELQGNVEIVGDESDEQDDLLKILSPPSGLNGGPHDIDDYTLLTSAYDDNRVNVYYVGRAWGNGHYEATANRAPIIIIMWIPSWRPDPSTLAHEVGHALGLDHPSSTDGAADNLMHGSLAEWRSRLAVGQLFLMNFAASSWAVLRPGSTRQPGCQTDRCPAWDVGVGK
jgi:hypothetical protein